MNKSPLLKHVSMKSYVIGFGLSLILTILAFGVVKLSTDYGINVVSFDLILPFIVFLAFIQLAVQLIFFLHLLKEKNPRWGMVFFVSTFSLIILIVVGSAWILNNLNYNMMPIDVGELIRIDEGIKEGSTNN